MIDKLRAFDWLLAAAVIALAVFGVFMIYAATNIENIPDSAVKFANMYRNQILFVASGAVLLFVFAFVDYHFITRFYLVIYGLCMLLLIIVMIIGPDEETSTARWIRVTIPVINEDLSIQPSELAKIFMIIFLAKFIDAHKNSFNHIRMLLVVLTSISVPVVMIFLQASLSASLLVLTITLLVLFTGGLYYRTIFAALAVAAPIAIAVWLDLQREEPLFMSEVLFGHQWERIDMFLNPVPGSDKLLQLEASLFSIGSGGMYGKGFMGNTYIPYGHNDFVFAVTAEQFGFVGSMCVLGVMAFIIVKCVLTALRACDLQGRLIASGVAGMLLFETFVHVGVVTGILPTTGMVFPFLSSGGSIMWVHMAAIGLVLNVAQPREKSMFDAERDTL